MWVRGARIECMGHTLMWKKKCENPVGFGFSFSMEHTLTVSRTESESVWMSCKDRVHEVIENTFCVLL